jgi:hypothetical protein
MPWKARPREPLEQENDTLKTTIVRLRHDLQTKQSQVGSLKLVLHQRLETIDELRGRIDQLREQNQRLDQEAESTTHLCCLQETSDHLF